MKSSKLIPLFPPLEKGENLTPPFCKGRLGGIIQQTRITETETK